MLDERLSLAASMYERCEVGADIGTDHAYLPLSLLKSGVCKRMLLCDVSEKALRHARDTVMRNHLEHCTRLICADGLHALDEPCGCISMTGMGGDTMRGILLSGRAHLHGAVLVLSAHTEQHLVRRAVQELGYHLVREELCLAAGRYYLVWRAEPGAQHWSEEALLYGQLLYEQPSPLLRDYLHGRIQVAQAKLRGLESASHADTQELQSTHSALTFYRSKLEAMV